MSLYGRIIQIEIGKAGTTGRSFSDFHISFDIKKTEFGKEPNTCKVTITNLSETLRSFIFAEKQKIIVKAGYLEESGPEVIYVGDITARENQIKRPEIITVIDAGDGAESLSKSKLSIAYSPGAQGNQILKEVVDSFKLPKKTNLSLIDIKKKIFSNGFNFNGAASTAMNKVCKNLGLNWSIQNDELKVYKQFNHDKSLAIELNSNTGLIGTPQQTKITTQESSDSQSLEIDGWSVDSLLQPKAEPGGIILLSSSSTGQNKKYKIITVQHTGDNMESDFKSTLQVVEI